MSTSSVWLFMTVACLIKETTKAAFTELGKIVIFIHCTVANAVIRNSFSSGSFVLHRL